MQGLMSPAPHLPSKETACRFSWVRKILSCELEFEDAEQEERFTQWFNRQQARRVERVAHLIVGLCFVPMLVNLIRNMGSVSVAHLPTVLCFLSMISAAIPFLLALRCRCWYARWREPLVGALRMFRCDAQNIVRYAMLQPGLTVVTPGKIFNILAVGTNCASLAGLSLGIRVRMKWHLLTQALVVFATARRNQHYCMQLAERGIGDGAFAGVTWWLDLISGDTLWMRPDTHLEVSQQAFSTPAVQCHTLLLFLQLFFGLLLPTMVLYFLERADRAAFLQQSRQQVRASEVQPHGTFGRFQLLHVVLVSIYGGSVLWKVLTVYRFRMIAY